MKTEIAIQGKKFFINNKPTYAGVWYKGRQVEGLLMNSRMIQAIFDDENPSTRDLWKYPDTGIWDAERNTKEFCEQLPVYRAHGLLAVTVGLQGGGSIYSSQVYDRYANSAITPDGTLKEAYFDRLFKIIKAADEAGMIVIVNYYYWKQLEKLKGDETLCSVTAKISEKLLTSGYKNILVDVFNEAALVKGHPVTAPARIHELLDIVRNTTVNGRRLLAGISTLGGDALAEGRWLADEDFALPHGNGCTPEQLTRKLLILKASAAHRKRPRPIVVNEDSTGLDNMKAAVRCGCSWGYYSQGYGCKAGDHDRHVAWRAKPREKDFAALSGFQTLPVNWSINTPEKKEFFDMVKVITSGK